MADRGASVCPGQRLYGVYPRPTDDYPPTYPTGTLPIPLAREYGRDVGRSVTGSTATNTASVLNVLPKIVPKFRMRWRDVDAVGVVYRAWTASGAEDPTGQQYAGPKAGATPISNARVSLRWTVTE